MKHLQFQDEHCGTERDAVRPLSDYAAWRKVYDSVAPMQKAGGMTAEAVYRGVDDSNEVTVIHEFASIEAARAFARSADLKAAMQTAGVVGASTVWLADKA
jgi:hypothetical protein